MNTVIVPGRFRGPPDSANGGVTAGLLAAHVPSPTAEVTLRRPPPLDTAIQVRVEGDTAELVEQGAVLAVARPGHLDIEVPAAVPLDAAVEATRNFAWHDHHPYPSCFVCGPDRSAGDGLRVFPGPVADTDLHAAAWTPDPGDAGGDGLVRPELLWAVLDCPSGFAAMARGAMSILGRMTARIDRRPLVGEPLVVVAWLRGIEGRKQHAASAIHDVSGDLVGLATATWIELR